jgi:hypothetical protein
MLATMTGPVAGGGKSAMGVTELKVEEVTAASHDGRWVQAGNVIVDRQTGASADVEQNPQVERFDGFVRDNPKLWLVWRTAGDGSGRSEGVYLKDSATGQNWRIDTDSSGAPLAPTWPAPGCPEDGCPVSANLAFAISVASISRDGRLAAFCANYLTAADPLLYVKDLASGRLTVTSVRCGV